MRVPFGGNSFYPDDKYTLTGSVYNEIVDNCMSNNLNASVFTVNKIDLDSISKISYDDIVSAIERAQKYIKY